MLVLKKIFNWFKLFLALDFIGVSIFLTASEYKEFDNGFNKWGPILISGIIFFSIGILLLLWFNKTRKKYKKHFEQKDSLALESSFYCNYPKFSNLIDNWSFNGFGTKFQTYSNKQSDGSLYAIKWIIIAFFPVTPLYQEKINIISETEKTHIPFFFSSSKLKFIISERVKLNSALIKATYVFYYLFFLPSLIIPIILLLIYIRELNELFSGASFWWVILAYLCWGVFLVFLTELFNKKMFLKFKFDTKN